MRQICRDGHDPVVTGQNREGRRGSPRVTLGNAPTPPGLVANPLDAGRSRCSNRGFHLTKHGPAVPRGTITWASVACTSHTPGYDPGEFYAPALSPAPVQGRTLSD